MSNPRKDFLTALFQILDRESVPYCVLRNYQNIYEDTLSDVDLCAEPEQIERVAACLGEAAIATHHRLVLGARYINLSYVYWHPEGGFLRMDVEAETRWRIFPVLSAKSIIGLRRREADFYIPHPRHESAILFAAAVWRGHLSERYRGQLARLHSQCGEVELRRTLRAAFGTAGDKLADCQARILKEMPPSDLWGAVKVSLIRSTAANAPNRRTALGYLASDLKRFWRRLHNPPGIAMLFVSSARPPRKMENFLERIKFLYPSEKLASHSLQLSSNESRQARLGLRLRVRRLYALFKGGLFLRFYEVANERDLRKAAHAYARHLYRSRTFICAENSRSEAFLAHVETGFMTDLPPVSNDAAAADDRMTGFISAILERQRIGRQSSGTTRGAFVVFVGLDGSGKTTVARKLCGLGLEQEEFAAIRYYHWQPRLSGDVEFPLPESDNITRKKSLRSNALRSAVSIARLTKNLVLANLAHTFRVRSMVRRGTLVVVDRYYYNYFLDPVSVKYYGPHWVLERLGKLFPRPDLVVVFKAPPSVLLARKQELAPEEILKQSEILDSLQFNAGRVIEVDACQPALETARGVMDEAVRLKKTP